VIALGVWTAAIAFFFWEAVSLKRALFYFDITEINFPYRDFLARELRAGRFSRWCPGLYCGFPLYSESQAGYLHPLKYLLYPWLATWQAFNLDTILSIWLAGVGTYGWLRRHVAALPALAGAAVFGLSGFMWAHLIHTSMTNALASVPFVFWALEWTWERGQLRGMALGALALAFQVFAGHLQDTLLTGMAVGLYGLYRACTERSRAARNFALGTSVGLVGIGVLVAAVQWIPSKELLDRSPRAGGLPWDEMTFGSWHPELLPTVLVREAYGTRARDTDWMDGYYPYHEMNVYLGVTGLVLALIGAAAYRDRWVGFWVLLALVGMLLMLGKFTFLFDGMHRLPIVGSSRIPVRYHLWVSIAAAALAAVGVDRIARPGPVALRPAFATLAALAIVSTPILAYIYAPVWTEAEQWTKTYHIMRYRWLGAELAWASVRTLLLVLATAWVCAAAVRAANLTTRGRLAALLPLLVIADLLAAHAFDVPTIEPGYWTKPPESAMKIKPDPTHSRVFGFHPKHAGEPGYASEPVDFFSVRDTLGWSLPPVWGLRSSIGETPIIPARLLRYTDNAEPGGGRLDLEGVSHLLTDSSSTISGWPRPEKAGTAFIHRNPNVLPRVRLAGRPFYAKDEHEAARALHTLGAKTRERVIVEDPAHPLLAEADISGTARLTYELPEHLEIAVDAKTDAYLILADTFDPGWWATLDGRPVPIRPAYVAFRAVFVPQGTHTVVFRYVPAGFQLGFMLTVTGAVLCLLALAWPRPLVSLGPNHGDARWPRPWPVWALAVALIIVAASAIRFGPDGVGVHPRWSHSWHPFTWGASIKAMGPPRPPLQ
jgi:hypothetical protein